MLSVSGHSVELDRRISRSCCRSRKCWECQRTQYVLIAQDQRDEMLAAQNLIAPRRPFVTSAKHIRPWPVSSLHGVFSAAAVSSKAPLAIRFLKIRWQVGNATHTVSWRHLDTGWLRARQLASTCELVSKTDVTQHRHCRYCFMQISNLDGVLV